MSTRRLVATAAAALATALLGAGCGESAREAKAPPRDDAAASLVGRWSGDLQQSGLDPFRVTADIRGVGPGAQSQVSYTGIDCAGRWSYLGRSRQTFRFREVIDRGTGKECKGTGEVTLERQGPDSLHYTFRGGGVESHGVLSRER